MGKKKKRGHPHKFPWKKASRTAARAGLWSAAAAGGGAAMSGEPITIAIMATIGFIVGVAGGINGEYVKHRNDDPLPVFDRETTFLFDTAGMVICLLLFVIPAFMLDHMVAPEENLPGYFGFASLFLSAFLLPVLRGLICNFGLAREEGEEEDQIMDAQ